jgi:hypothetical protein
MTPNINEALSRNNILSNRHPYETQAIEQVCSYLLATRGVEYRISGEHVPVGNHNCDYVLTNLDGSATIAIEIVRIVDDPASMEQHRWRSVLWDALKRECAMRGISGFIVRTPWTLEEPPREIRRQLAPRVADGVAEILRDNPHASFFTVEGFEFRRASDMDGIGSYTSGGAHYVDTAGGSADILETLEDKDSQLACPQPSGSWWAYRQKPSWMPVTSRGS